MSSDDSSPPQLQFQQGGRPPAEYLHSEAGLAGIGFDGDYWRRTLPGEHVHVDSSRIVTYDEDTRSNFLQNAPPELAMQHLRRSRMMAEATLHLLRRQLPHGRVEWINTEQHAALMRQYADGIEYGLGPNDHDWIPIGAYAEKIKRPLANHEVGLYLMGRTRGHHKLRGTMTCIRL